MSSAASTDRTVLIGFEPTPAGEDALAFGALLAESLGARPLVARVLRRPPGVVDPEQIEELLAGEADSATARLPERLSALGSRTVAIAHDSVGGALFEIASDQNAIAVVVGSGRGGVLGRVLPGSTGQALLHGAPCAVAVAPRGFAEGEPGKLLRIGVGYDGSPEASEALATAIGIASSCRARLWVVTIADFVSYGYASTWSVLSAGEIHDRELEAKQRTLDEALARVPQDLPVEGRLMRGGAGQNLVALSEEVDLLLVGSRAYGPLRRTLLGSASSRLLADSRCPVLVLPRGVGSEPFTDPPAGAQARAAG